MKYNFGQQLLVLATLTTFIGCSGTKSASTLTTDPTLTSTTSTDTSATSTALPSNLFDTSTSSDTASTASLTPATATASQQLCTTSDAIYGNFGSLTPASSSSTSNGYYCAGSTIDQSALEASAAQALTALQACYQTVIDNAPTATDSYTVAMAIRIGGMAVSRCTRQYLRSIQGFGGQNGGWSPYQSSVYNGDDRLLWSFLRAFSPH